MKYFFRFLGVIILWPSYLTVGLGIKLIINIFSVLWNFSFKEWDEFTIKDIYFPLGRHGEFNMDKNYKAYLKEYDLCYKTPLDMLKNNISRFDL